MTKTGTMLSVRLDAALAAALERHCAQTGATRSRVVQQSMAQYLVAQSGPTLGQLAEALLPPLAKRPARPARLSRAAPRPRQQRFRDYVRDKRHR
jgi:ribbon-helix-helix CopG family protein